MRVLLVDLNNFARYPTVAIGLLASVLRRAGISVEVLSPLSVGIPGVEREPRVGRLGRIDQYLRFVSSQSRSLAVRAVRARLAARRLPMRKRETSEILEALDRALQAGPDAVMVSAYLMYRHVVEAIAARCEARRVPVILGGPYFAQPEVIDAWRAIPGVSAVLAGEGEPHAEQLVRAAVSGLDLSAIPGVSTRGVRRAAAPPIADLDSLPFPDYGDFPWERYPNRLVPLIASRGCGWGRCSFCSDVTSASGRSFRARTAQNVLDEMAHQARACDSQHFVFTDLKLNSSLPLWYGLLEGAQRTVPGCRWIAAVHADGRSDNGLGVGALKDAAAAGMVRLTTGLESGSQRILDSMRKGTELARTEKMLRDAWEVGISARLTMIVGYPGEEPADVEASAAFLERNARHVGRVLVNRFAMITGTRIHRRLRRGFAHRETLEDVVSDEASATWPHRYGPARSAAYRRAVWRLLGAVHAINRRPLQLSAKAFEGVM